MSTNLPNNMDAFWMPFTANRQFKQAPRLIKAAKGIYYTDIDNKQIIDGTSGLWCCNVGHGRKQITEAITNQLNQLDFAPSHQMSHPLAFELSSKLVNVAPKSMDHVFYSNSGSESVETALKIALAYHKSKGDGSRTRLIGRERGYHGVNFGGISVGGMVANRKQFGTLLSGVDHIRHTHLPEKNAFTNGQPEYGDYLADDLERLVALHDASTIAAVIIEPMAGSTGVLLPPKGYLQRLRKICDAHGILLIFDEVITGFGRLGSSFAAEHFNVIPDLIVTAKGLTNGIIPMGAVFVTGEIYNSFMDNAPENTIEFFHGYTYSANPVACAAALATLNIYKDEGLLTRASELEKYWGDAIHQLKDCPNVIDIRNMGLVGAIELQPIDGLPTKRAYNALVKAFEMGLLIRTTGDVIALSPPLIITKNQINDIFTILRQILINLD